MRAFFVSDTGLHRGYVFGKYSTKTTSRFFAFRVAEVALHARTGRETTTAATGILSSRPVFRPSRTDECCGETAGRGEKQFFKP